MNTINFKEAMAARARAKAAAGNAAPAGDAPYVDPEATLVVRAFTPEGIARVTDLLREMRVKGTVLQDDVDELVDDIEYTKTVDDRLRINPGRTFATKLELCEYFTRVFSSEFLVQHRRDKGLWTWLALVYFKQFVKTKNHVVGIASDSRWIYQGINYRFVRRHFIAGALYLYIDIRNCGESAIRMLLDSSPAEFGRMIDALTNVEDSIRNQAFLSIAAKLYYDPNCKSRYKQGATDQGKPGSVRQLTRLIQQYRMTHDFVDSSDAKTVYEMLPAQFGRFKR